MSKVRDFHLREGLPAPNVPPLTPDANLVRARMRELAVEYERLRRALTAINYAPTPDAALDALRDALQFAAELCYVAEGTAVSLGLPFEEAFDAVHQARMGRTEPNMLLVLPNHIDHQEVTSP